MTEPTHLGQVEIYDTTLRDGTQREGLSLSVGDKLRIARRLDELGVSIIEGGWPGSNPKDAEFFQRAQNLPWQCAQVAAFGATRRANLSVETDSNLRSLLEANTRICTVVGKTSTLHVTSVLHTSLAENLRMIRQSVAFLRSHHRRVIYDAEHFFDGYKDEPEYALECLRAAIQGGAETIVLCDTNGGTMPWEVYETVRAVLRELNHPVGIHAHNDAECAVANTLAAVRAGAVHVQGTINGYGERCGNANLCAVIPGLQLKLGLRCLPEGSLSSLYDAAHFVAEVANLAFDEHSAYVGRSAFAHKGGIHGAAMRREPRSYQHIDPSLVGNRTRMVVSELAGTGTVLNKAEEMGIEIRSAEHAAGVLSQIKALEARGFCFEAAEASLALLMRRRSAEYLPPFQLVDYAVVVEHRQGRNSFAEATIKVRVNDTVLQATAEGNGPVNALDAALRKALTPVFPALNAFQLIDYKVRILDGSNGTRATTRVLIDTCNGQRSWSTVGASTNIIEASWLALADSVEYGLTTTT